MSKLLHFLLIAILIPFSIEAQWIKLQESLLTEETPAVALLDDSKLSATIKIDLSGFKLEKIISGEKTYQNVDLLTGSFYSEPGSPAVPYISKVLAVPNNAKILYEITDSSAPQKFSNISLPPARESQLEGEVLPPYIENKNIYNSDKIFPSDLVEIGSPVIFRDFRIVRVSFFPVRYNPVKKELDVIQSITVKIIYNNGGEINVKHSPQRAIPPSFAKLYRSTIFNYESVLERDFAGREDGLDVMLCIVPDQFYDSFLPYAEWKHKSGTFIHITKFSDINANSSDPNIIKNHIADAYFNWENPPTYVLLVGDDGIFPLQYVYYDYTFPNEDFFVELEGNDVFPEMMIGRMTNQDDYRLRVILNKLMKYERTPYIQNTDWYKKAIVCSNNAYPSQVDTKRYTASILFNEGNFTHVDTVMSASPCPANIGFIKNAIAQGRSFVNYRGEGWIDGWMANCYSFLTNDVASLNNGEKLPLLTSIGCGVAMFNANGVNCFGEQWLENGSLNNSRGACAFIGPTSNTHTSYNNRIDMGIYDGMFKEGLETPGQALLRGKLNMYLLLGYNHWVEYHYRIYCVLGDPSIRVWKDAPRQVNVQHNSSIYLGYSQIGVTVTDSITGGPVQNARVTVSSDDIYLTDTTNAQGEIVFSLTTENVDSLKITVVGQRVYPYESGIPILAEGEYIAPSDEPAVSDLDGNTDGIINPNEKLEIIYTLKNWGTLPSENIQAALETDYDDFISIITTDPVNFGDLPVNSQVTGDPFYIKLRDITPLDTTLSVTLNVTSNTSNWQYIYQFKIKGCKLAYSSEFINDEGSDLNNYRLDPGETVKVILKVANNGFDIAPSVEGILHCDSPWITILDSVGHFGTIGRGDSSQNFYDYFSVKLDETAQDTIGIPFSIALSTSGGFYPYSNSIDFTIPVGFVSSFDPTGPDNYGYYSYSTEDDFFVQAPEFITIDLSVTGNEIEHSIGESAFCEEVDLPFTFRYYGIDYNTVTIGSDGWVKLGGVDASAPLNFPIPNVDNIKGMIAVFWDDLFSNHPQDAGRLLYRDNPYHHRFEVEWSGVDHFNDHASVESFQLILLDPAYYPTATGDGEIIMQYLFISEEESCTIGIESPDESTGIQLLFDNIYNRTASMLKNGSAIKFTTEPPVTILTGAEIETSESLPKEFSLVQNYPNPFNPSTKIRYSVPVSITGLASVKLNIYDILGREIATLVDSRQSAGNYEVTFNTAFTGGLPSGVYFYRITITGNSRIGGGNYSETKKMILLK